MFFEFTIVMKSFRKSSLGRFYLQRSSINVVKVTSPAPSHIYFHAFQTQPLKFETLQHLRHSPVC